MPDLTTNQLSFLEAALASLEQELSHLLTTTEAGTKPVKLKDNQGRLSRMDELHNQSILVANRTLTSNRLKAVVRAKQRMDIGIYGICTSCEEPIAFNRLVAYPDAVMCFECKSESEAL